MKLFAYRVFGIYFFLYILFISSFLNSYEDIFPWLQSVNKPLNYIGTAFGHWLYRTTTGETVPPFAPIHIMDAPWNLTAVLGIFTIGFSAALIWTMIDKDEDRRWSPFINTVVRYYLVFILFFYGIPKLFLHQFPSPPSPLGLIKPIVDFDPRRLFWFFMGSSTSYQIFAGTMEIVAGLLLLFRRTYIIGSFLTIGVFLNTLMLNIGYDTPIKLFLIHLLLMSCFVISAELLIIGRFLTGKPISSLNSPLQTDKDHFFNLSLIMQFFLVIFLIMAGRKEYNDSKEFKKNAADEINGLFTIEGNNVWKKMAIDLNYAAARIQRHDDSLEDFNIERDRLKGEFVFRGATDTSLQGKINYSELGKGRWKFDGKLGQDSVHFIASKLELKKTQLFKTYNQWKFW